MNILVEYDFTNKANSNVNIYDDVLDIIASTTERNMYEVKNILIFKDVQILKTF